MFECSWVVESSTEENVGLMAPSLWLIPCQSWGPKKKDPNKEKMHSKFTMKTLKLRSLKSFCCLHYQLVETSGCKSGLNMYFVDSNV